MILLRRVLGDALRARRQSQHRTLREVSGAANVSLGYLSEIERGQKEASSELLSAICDALGAQMSEVLRDVSETMEFAELTEAGLGSRFGRTDSDRFGRPDGDGRLARVAAGGQLSSSGAGAMVDPVGAADETPDPEPAIEFSAPEFAASEFAGSDFAPHEAGTVTNVVGDDGVSVAVRHDGPLKTILHATRTGAARRDVVRAA